MLDKVAAASSDRILSLLDVGFAAGATAILTNANLDIRSGAPTVLIGPNGSGKTTLLKLAAGLIEPVTGTVAHGSDVTTTAFVFQHPVMLRRSAAANLAFALRNAGRTADRATIEGLLNRVGLSRLGDRPARRLSGGERQRLALARALARRPDILFLDEPTASLDPRATHLVEQIISSVAGEGTKVVMATHDLGQARRLAGDIVFLALGRIVECSPAGEFFSSPRTEAARQFLAGDLVM